MPTAKQNQKFSFLNFRFSAGGVGGADKKWKENFWFLLPRPKGADEAREIRAYDLVSLHHARGACDIICFENRCELGTIKTPEYKLPNRPIWQLIFWWARWDLNPQALRHMILNHARIPSSATRP